MIQCSSVTQSCPTLRPHESQHARPPCPSPTPRVYPNPCPWSWWWHPDISSSVVPFSSCPQSFPTLGSFPMSQLFRTHIIKYISFSVCSICIPHFALVKKSRTNLCHLYKQTKFPETTEQCFFRNKFTFQGYLLTYPHGSIELGNCEGKSISFL